MSSFVRPVVKLASSWQGWIVMIVLATQLLIPLHYYFARRDRHDERFAWRMFSPMRMTRCTPRFVVDGKPLDLMREFHEAWVETASRGRFVVVEAMGAHVCAKRPKGTVVEVSLDCTYIDGKQQTFGGYDMCTVPVL